MEKKSFDELVTKIEEFHEQYSDYFTYGELDGRDFVIIESWEQLNSFNAFLNGYDKKFSGSEPYVPNDKTLKDIALELTEQLKQDPNNWNLKGRAQNALDYLEYSQFLSNKGIERPASIDDYDCDTGFSDQYSTCSCCNSIISTDPGCYTALAPLITEDGWVCDKCVAKGQADDFILEELCNKAASLPSKANIDRLGLVQINKETYQHGMFDGMNDSPEPIIKALNNENVDCWFKVYPSQFYQEFDVLVKNEDQEKAIEILSKTSAYQGYSTSGNLEKCLKQVSINSAKDSSEGIRYTTCNLSDGTVNTKIISTEDFINKGIK